MYGTFCFEYEEFQAFVTYEKDAVEIRGYHDSQDQIGSRVALLEMENGIQMLKTYDRFNSESENFKTALKQAQEMLIKNITKT